jgi:hypothetical protein
MALHRGGVYAYAPVLPHPGRSLLRLIVSADALNDSSIPITLGLQVVDHDPGGLLSVHLDGHGWAVVTTVEQVMKRRIGELGGRISTDEQHAVDNALRAALEL